jgi:hypothetical protein
MSVDDAACPALGFHFYGADLCLHDRDKGLAAVAGVALCYHNQRAVELPPDSSRADGRSRRSGRTGWR